MDINVLIEELPGYTIQPEGNEVIVGTPGDRADGVAAIWARVGAETAQASAEAAAVEAAAAAAAVPSQLDALRAEVPAMSPVQSVAGLMGPISDQQLRVALGLGVFSSRAAARTAAIPVVVETLTTLGYAAEDGRGGASYRRASVPGPGGFVDAAGGAWEIVGEVLNPYQFGAVGDGVTDDRAALIDWWAAVQRPATSFGAQYPTSQARTGFVPPARFWADQVLQLVSYSTGITVQGCGPASMLDRVELHIGGNRSNVDNIACIGASAWGVRAFGARRRTARFTNVWTRNKLYGVTFEGPGGADIVTACTTEQCTGGLVVVDTLDLHVSNSEFHQPVSAIAGLSGGMGGIGIRQMGGGQFKTSNVAAAGIRASMLVTGETRGTAYECYHNNLSCAGLTNGRQRPLPILGVTNNGVGLARLQTSQSWGLVSVADRGGRFVTRSPQAATVIISGTGGSVTSVRAGFAEILSIASDVPPPVAWAGSAAATAAAIAAAIRVSATTHGWTAVAHGAALTVIATNPHRPMDTLRLEVTGAGGMASPSAAFGAITHGDAYVSISTTSTTGGLASLLAGDTEILGAPVPWYEDGVTTSAIAANNTAAAVAAQINLGTEGHGYAAYAISNRVHLVAPLVDGAAAHWRSLVPVTTGGLLFGLPYFAAITLAAPADFVRGDTIGLSGTTAGGYDGYAEVVHTESSSSIGIQLYAVGTTPTTGYAYHPNRLIDGDRSLSVSTGISAYDGVVDIVAAGETWVDITRAYTVNATGVLSAYNWDLEFQPADASVRLNDHFFVGGNLNYVLIGGGYHLGFGHVRHKLKIQIDPQINQALHANRISFMGSGRGRDAESSYLDVKVGGAWRGWSLMGPRDDSGGSNPGKGYLAMSVPDATLPRSNNRVGGYNEIRVREDGVISLTVGGYIAQMLNSEFSVFGHRLRRPSNVATPINGIDIVSGASGAGVGVYARGETNVPVILSGAGDGDAEMRSGSGASRILRARVATGQPSNPNHVVVQAAVSGQPASISASEGPLRIGTPGSALQFLGLPQSPSYTRQTLPSSTGSRGEPYISNPETGKSCKVIDSSTGWRYIGDNSLVSLI